MPTPGKLKKLAAEKGITVEQLIKEALVKADGKKTFAAIALGVYPGTLYSYLDRHPMKCDRKQN